MFFNFEELGLNAGQNYEIKRQPFSTDDFVISDTEEYNRLEVRLVMHTEEYNLLELKLVLHKGRQEVKVAMHTQDLTSDIIRRPRNRKST